MRWRGLPNSIKYMKIYIRGGIGDFLQCLPFVIMQPKNEYYIHTHFKKAEQFFKDFGVDDPKVYIFKDAEEHDAQIDDLMKIHDGSKPQEYHECPRYFYSSLNFSEEIKSVVDNLVSTFKETKDIIGIHPFGSEFAKNIYSKFNLPQKFIPAEITKELISQNNNYLIFGTKEELSGYGVPESDNVKHVCFDNISHSLASVLKCKKFFGVDSCFKTMSSIHEIPTFCLVGDFNDPTRDVMFIDQYVKDDVMKIFKFKDMTFQKEEILDFFYNTKT